jgi:hypothetical protein
MRTIGFDADPNLRTPLQHGGSALGFEPRTYALRESPDPVGCRWLSLVRPADTLTDRVLRNSLRAKPVDCVRTGNLVGQALRAGLVDELRIDLVPVVFGSGVRYFGNYDESTRLLEDPEIVQGDRVTHLHYRIRK